MGVFHSKGIIFLSEKNACGREYRSWTQPCHLDPISCSATAGVDQVFNRSLPAGVVFTDSLSTHVGSALDQH